MKVIATLLLMVLLGGLYGCYRNEDLPLYISQPRAENPPQPGKWIRARVIYTKVTNEGPHPQTFIVNGVRHKVPAHAVDYPIEVRPLNAVNGIRYFTVQAVGGKNVVTTFWDKEGNLWKQERPK